MNLMAILALCAAWLLGALIVASLWPRDHSLRRDWTLILPLGLILGLAATAIIFFGMSLLSTRPAVLAAGIELATCAALIARLWTGVRKRKEGAVTVERTPLGAPRTPATLVATGVWASIFVQAAVVAGIIASREYRAEPLGGWDGWAIWNMHARFMLRAGQAWPELLRAPQLSWSHPDYPPLLPAAVARLWSWAGEEVPLAPALVGMAFAVATLGILVAVVAKRRNADIALIGGIVLLATPFFVTFAPNQHADIPLGSFMLAAVALSLLADGSPQTRGRWTLAGLCAGCAAWTKNEGVLFALAFAGAVGVRMWRAKFRPAAASFLAALAVTLSGWLYFKFQLAPSNDLMSAPLGPRIGHVINPARHATILSALWRDLGRFGEWSIAPWIALLLPFAAWRARRPLGRAERIAPSMLALMLAGYYGVYLITPQALAWHLDTSLVRLLLQLWPLLILTWCLAIPDWIREEWPPARSTPRVPRWGWWVGANAVVAAGAVSVLSTQRGANELVVRRVGRAEVSAMVGEGWFALERHGRDEWAWSSGQATLPLHVKGPEPIGPLSMQFALRGVGSRTVTVRQAGRVLWEGAVGPQHVPVTISGMMLAPGTTTLEFSTDAPGIAESAAVGGRSLAFALYNLRLK